MIEQSRPLTSDGVTELGDTFTDPALRKLFLRHETTMAVASHSFSDVVLDTITTIVLQDGAAVHCGGYRHDGELAAAIRRLETLPDDRLRDRRVFLAYHKFNNYHHWMTECIPAIASYQMDPDFADGVLLLPSEMAITDTMWQAIRLATCNRQLPAVFAIGRQQLPIRELVFSSFFQPHAGPSPFANALFDRMANQISQSNRLPHRRLYVSRKDSARSPIVNEDALIALLIGYDIEPIVPGRLSQADQISAFRDAELVIGTHGAGLTNIAFMQPGTLVYEIFPSCLVRPCFNVLCQGRGIHYLADVFWCPAPPRPRLEDFRNLPWQIDLGVVERRLAAINGNFDQH